MNLMKIITLPLLLCHIVCSLFAQQKSANPGIAAFENGLRVDVPFVWADSAVKNYSLEERMKFHHVPSVSIAVINHGKIEWAKAYGKADIDHSKPSDVNTLYQAASISKSINALCVMKLVQDEKLSLDKDIRSYLKTWIFPDNDISKSSTVTLRNLLSHTAGLNLHGFRGYATGEVIPTINQMLEGKTPANNEAVATIFKPGTKQEYSGGGTLITKKILLDNIDPDYAALLDKMVLRPLGMHNSSFAQPLNKKWKNVASGYDQNEKAINGSYYIYPEQAPDGLWTTASDYAEFIISVQQSLKNNPRALLHQSTAEIMLTPVLNDAALGVFVKEKGGEKYFWHEGANVGFRCSYYGSFSTGNGVVVLTNSDNGNALINEIINDVARVYGWKDFYNPVVIKKVTIPDSLQDEYAGEYRVESPAMKISIVKTADGLLLTARRPEKMYFTSRNSFLLLSAPSQLCEFTADGLLLKEGGRILFSAKKIK